MIVEPFKIEHLRQMVVQPAQRDSLPYVTDDYLDNLINSGPALTAILDGQPVACFGMIDAGPTHGVLWSFLSSQAISRVHLMHRVARRFITSLGKKQLQAFTDANFDNGCRWLEKLGFEYHHDDPDMSPDGRLFKIYVRNF